MLRGKQMPVANKLLNPILMKDELILLISYRVQAQIQVVCSSLEEAITKMV